MQSIPAYLSHIAVGLAFKLKLLSELDTATFEPGVDCDMRLLWLKFELRGIAFRAYPWLLNYINRHSVRQTRHLSVHTAVRQAESGRTLTTFSYLPGHGMHYFVHNYRWIQVHNCSIASLWSIFLACWIIESGNFFSSSVFYCSREVGCGF